MTKINAQGTGLIYSTYLGGKSSLSATAAEGIAVDAAGSAYVAGSTTAADFHHAVARHHQRLRCVRRADLGHRWPRRECQ